MTDKCKQQQCANPSWCKLTGKCLVEKFPQTTGLAPDCRTCRQFVIRSHGCGAIGVCVNGNSYVALPVVRLWENTK